MDDQVSWSLTPAEQAEVETALATLHRVLGPKFKHLTASGRQEIAKMGDKTVAFVQKALEYSGSHPELLPSYVDRGAMVVDLKAVETLAPLTHELSELAQGASDTKTLAGSEAYLAALAFYQSVRTAARNHVPGAEAIYRDLASRFPGAPSKPTTP
jgi:hypothetical protein